MGREPGHCRSRRPGRVGGLFWLSDHPAERDPGMAGAAHARTRAGVRPGRGRAGRHQHGLRRGLHRRARDDLLLQPRHQPDAGRIVLHRRHRGPDGAGQRDARRAGAGQHRPLAGRLQPDLQGRRPRGLPSHRAGARLGPGSRGPDARWPSTWPRST